MVLNSILIKLLGVHFKLDSDTNQQDEYEN